jgi:hypothetical protein
MQRLDQRAYDRISGPSWEAIRPQFTEINDALLQVSEETKSELTTIYIKYRGPSSRGRPVPGCSSWECSARGDQDLGGTGYTSNSKPA